MFRLLALSLSYLSQIVIFITSEYFSNTWPLFLLQNHLLSRALLDNCIHGITAFLCMLTTCLLKDKSYLSDFLNINKLLLSVITLNELILCTLFACIIDIDHFLAAKSFNLKAATSLQHRPLFHCTTGMLMIPIFITLLNYFQQSDLLYKFTLSLVIAITTHHLRDGLRRGLWIYPFKSTQPIPHWLYITVILSLPHLCYWFTKSTKSVTNNMETINIV